MISLYLYYKLRNSYFTHIVLMRLEVNHPRKDPKIVEEKVLQLFYDGLSKSYPILVSAKLVEFDT
jgi:hypothetical protein